MPSAFSYFLFGYTTCGFVVLVIIIVISSSINEIKKNWTQYRCNPIYMPLADNIEQNFVYCVQTMQSSFMGYLTKPIEYTLSLFSGISAGFVDAINNVRKSLSSIRSASGGIFATIYSVILNMIIEFQRVTIGIENIMGQIIGIVVTFMYIMEAAIDSMQSAWAGPPGQMLRSLSGIGGSLPSCFHPCTKIRLPDRVEWDPAKNALHRKPIWTDIKSLLPNQRLYNGSIVRKVLHFHDNGDPFYTIGDEGVFVTGEHYVFDSHASKTFVKVKNHPLATQVPQKKEIDIKWVVSVVTSDHLIVVGAHVFWDWEDDIFL